MFVVNNKKVDTQTVTHCAVKTKVRLLSLITITHIYGTTQYNPEKQKQGKYDEAIPYLEKALQLREKLGKGHQLDIALTRDELATCLHGLGDKEAARAMRMRGGASELICSYEPCSAAARQKRMSKLLCCTRCACTWHCSQACRF